MNPDDLMTITEAARHARVSRQAIYVALRDNRLKGAIRGRKWFIKREDLDFYRSQKYIGDNRKNNGARIFNLEEGRYSVHQLSKFMTMGLGRPYPMQRVYFVLRRGRIKAMRVGAAWVIMKEDAIALLQDEQAREAKRMGLGA
jgi:excisionase family DNA binding protein